MSKAKPPKKSPTRGSTEEPLQKLRGLRPQILEAFLELVHEKGFDATTLDDIGRKVGVRRNHVGYYYPSRRSLLAAAVEHCIGTGQEMTARAMAEAQDPQSLILAWTVGAFDWLQKYPKHKNVMLVFFSFCAHDESFRSLNDRICMGGIERVQYGLFTFSAKRGGKEHLSSHQLLSRLRAIQTLVWGQLMRWLTTSESDCQLLKKEVQNAALALFEADIKDGE